MTMMMTGVAAADMVAGTAIPRVTRKPRAAAGKSVRAPAAARATITMMTGAAAADMAAGTAIRKGTLKRHAADGGNVNLAIGLRGFPEAYCSPSEFYSASLLRIRGLY